MLISTTQLESPQLLVLGHFLAPRSRRSPPTVIQRLISILDGADYLGGRCMIVIVSPLLTPAGGWELRLQIPILLREQLREAFRAWRTVVSLGYPPVGVIGLICGAALRIQFVLGDLMYTKILTQLSSRCHCWFVLEWFVLGCFGFCSEEVSFGHHLFVCLVILHQGLF